MNDVAPKFAHGGVPSDFLIVHRDGSLIAHLEHRLHHRIVKDAVGVGKLGDLDAQVVLQKRLGILQLPQHPLLKFGVVLLSLPGTQAGVGHAVAAHPTTVRHHLLDLRPLHRTPTDVHVLFVEVDREGKPHLLQHRKGILIDALPTIIHRDGNRGFRDVLLTPLPSQHIRHRDHRNSGLLDRGHLLAKFRSRNDHRTSSPFSKVVVTENRHHRCLVQLKWLRLGHILLHRRVEHTGVLRSHLNRLFFRRQFRLRRDHWGRLLNAARLGQPLQLGLDLPTTRQRQRDSSRKDGPTRKFHIKQHHDG